MRYDELEDWKRTHLAGELPSKGIRFCVMGWVEEKEETKNKIILKVRDYTGYSKLVVEREKCDPSLYERLSKITPESVIGLRGITEEGFKGGAKINLQQLKIFNLARAPYPPERDKMSLASVELLPKRHLIIRTPKMFTILKVRDVILSSLRKFFHEEGFVEFPSQTIQWATDPGVRTAHLYTLIPFRKTPYVLASSAQLYKQAAIAVFDKVFTIAPALRSEIAVAKLTGRHLCDFWELDVEMAFATYDDVMALAERMIRRVVQEVKRACKEELRQLKRKLRTPKIPFEKLTHSQAVEIANEAGIKTGKEEEISWKAESYLSTLYKHPIWVIDYPVKSRAWYYRQDQNNPRIAKTMDLLYPEGYGEGITGGEREYDYETLVRRIKESGDKVKKYSWYIEMFKYGMPPSAGFGLGIERLVRFICGLEYIWEATLFPRVPGIISP